jgi:DeoR/GlpR family transcriptional regulator of sugar metabolism
VRLVRELEVSRDTIRRDLEDLADAGLLVRVHGGALPAAIGGQPYHVRREQAFEAKDAIGIALVRMMRPGSVVFLDAGTAALAVARALPPELRATIATNSPRRRRSSPIPPRGGLPPRWTPGQGSDRHGRRSDPRSDRRDQRDVSVLGVCSVHPELGISVMDLEEARVKRAMIGRSAEVIAATAAEKLGSQGPYVVGPIEELTAIVTDPRLRCSSLTVRRGSRSPVSRERGALAALAALFATDGFGLANGRRASRP